jgi:hypothetical protein
MPIEPIYTVFTIALGLKTKFVQRPVDKLFVPRNGGHL